MKRIIKKSFALITALCVTASAFTAIPVSADANGGLLVKESFNGKIEDSHVTASSINADGTSSDTSRQIIADVSGDPLVKSALFYGKNSNNITVTLPVQSAYDSEVFEKEGANSKITVEFDAKFASPSAGQTGTASETSQLPYEITVGSSDDNINSSKSVYINPAAAFGIDANGELYAIKYSAKYKKEHLNGTVKNVEAKTWQHYKIVINLTDSEKALQTYSLYVDGEPAAENLPCFGGDGKNGARIDRIDSIKFGGRSASNDSINKDTNSFGIANLSVYKSNTGNAELSAEQLILSLREIGNSKAALESNAAVQGTQELADFQAAYTAAQTAFENAYTSLDMNSINSANATLISTYEALKEAVNKKYPAGGYQVNNSFNTESEGKWDDAFDIGYAPVKTVRKNESTELWLFGDKDPATDESDYVEGIQVYKGTSDKLTGEWNYENEGPNATLIAEYDIKFDNIEGKEISCTINLTDRDAVAAYKTYCPLGLNLSGADFENGKWYRFRHEIYATNASGQRKNKMSTWIDGKKILDNVSFGTYNSDGTAVSTTASYQKFPNPDAVRILIDNRKTVYDDGITFSYDNVKCYKANLNAPMLVNDGALVAAIRKWDRYETITGDSTLAAALVQAKAAYGAEDKTQESIDNALAALSSAASNMADSNKPYKAETFSYVNASGVKTYEPVAGGKINGIYVSKNGKYSKTAKLTAVVFENNVLTGIATADIAADAINVGDTAVIPTELSLPQSGIENCEVKAFIWADDMQPLADVKSERGLSENRNINVYIAGDSLAQDYTDSYYPQAGWGQMIVNYFDDGVTVKNNAIGGRSTKSFIKEGRLDNILNEIQPGDYLFVSFMHNDQKNGTGVSTDPNTTYADNLYKYISAARDKGAIPVINIPIPRGLFSGTEKIGFYGKANLGAYPAAAKETARKYGVICTNALDSWTDMIENGLVGLSGSDYTAQVSKLLNTYYLFVSENDSRFDADKLASSSYVNGAKDTTHLQEYGADIMAQMIINELKNIESPVKKHITNEHTPIQPGE